MSHHAIKVDHDETGRNNAVLHHHSFIDGPISISFHSYYNDNTPIYYELEPFIAPLRLVSVAAAVNFLPESWVQTVKTLNDPNVFDEAALNDSTVFVQAQSIQYLLNVHDDKIKYRKFIRHLYDLCLNEIENDRRIDERRIMKAVCRDNAELKKHTEKHATALDVIHDTFTLISERHLDITNAISVLLDKLFNHAITASIK